MNNLTFEKIKKLARQGCVVSQYNLGQLYYYGEGVKKNYKDSMKWYTLAAEQGHAHAQYLLGCLYDNGLGVTMNKKEAVKWYKRSGEIGRDNIDRILSHQ